MNNFVLGIKALFRIWGDARFADQVRELLEEPGAAPAAQRAPETKRVVAEPPPKQAPARSEALTLLAVLQREARFLDFIKEPITDYSDAQIGAAVRGVHKDCGALLDRLFAIETLRTEPEGTSIEVPPGFDPAQFRLIGNIPEHPPYGGTVSHSGWKATRCEVPQWNGRDESALVIAPCEVELK
jgi:hypothetical protein